jgi:hypothetical protein
LAKEVQTKRGVFRALVVKGHMSNPWHRLRSLPAAPLVVRRRYLIKVPMPFPAAPLVVRRKYLAVMLWPLPRCSSRVLNRGAQANARGATQVLRRGGQAVARGSCVSQVFGRGAQAVPEKPFPVRRRYLILVYRLFPAASLAVRCTYLTAVPRPVPRPFPAATRRCRSRRRTLGRFSR